MHELVIIHASWYHAGDHVDLDGLLKADRETTNKWGNCRHLWWFDYPIPMTLEKNTMRLDEQGTATMLRDAIRFRFDCLPNVRVNHFDVSCLYSEHNFNGQQVFYPFIDQLVSIVKQHTSPFTSWYDFYGLFEVEMDENLAEDGGIDSIDVAAEFLGEWDMDTLAVTPESLKVRQQMLSALGKDEDPPHYWSRD